MADVESSRQTQMSLVSERLNKFAATAPAAAASASATASAVRINGEEMETGNNKKNVSKIKLYFSACLANLAVMCVGNVLSWVSPVLPKLSSPGERILLTTEEGSWVASIVGLGAFFGPLVTSTFVDRIGRKWSILANLVVLAIHGFVLLYATTAQWMYAARFMAGVSAGSIFNVVPMYVAEISCTKTRGSTGSMMLFFNMLGACICYIIGPRVSYAILTSLLVVLPAVSFLSFIWLPESPLYLLMKGQSEAATVALQWFRGALPAAAVEAEITDLQAMLNASKKEEENGGGSKMKQLFKWHNFKTLYYGCAVMAIQQLAGINCVNFYAQSIFESAKSGLDPSTSTMLMGFLCLGTGLIVPYLPKLLRIQKLLYVSLTGCGISMFALGWFFYLQHNGSDVSALSWVPIVSILGFEFSHAIGIGSYGWVIVAEIFPAHLKALYSALATSLCWFFTFLTTRCFATFIQTLGPAYTFWIFVVFAAVGVLFVSLQLPETEGLTFQEIQDLMRKKKSSSSGNVGTRGLI